MLFSHTLSAGRIACQCSLCALSVAKWAADKQIFQCLSADVAQLAAATVIPTDQRPFFTLFVCLQIEQRRFPVGADAVQLPPVCWADEGGVLLVLRKAPSSCNCSTSRARSAGSNCGAATAATLATTCAVSGLARDDRVVTVAATHGISVDD